MRRKSRNKERDDRKIVENRIGATTRCEGDLHFRESSGYKTEHECSGHPVDAEACMRLSSMELSMEEPCMEREPADVWDLEAAK